MKKTMKKGLIYWIIMLLIINIFTITTNSLNSDEPVWIWAKKAGGSSDDFSKCVIVDGSGNSYITGYFTGSATFGSTTLTSEGAMDIFVSKLSSNGAWQWAKSAGSGGTASCDEGNGIALDGNSNVYITGYFQGTATFGSTTLTTSGYKDIFVAKLNTNGAWQWAVQAGGSGITDVGYGISLDGSSNVYVTGDFSGTATFGSTTLYGGGGFVAKLNTNGAWQWAKGISGSPDPKRIKVDSSGNSYITGYFMDSATFGSTTLTSSATLWDMFVAKLNTNGAWQWAKGSSSSSSCTGFDITIGSSGSIYVVGTFTGTTVFGSIQLTSSNDDAIVAKLNTNGAWQWAKNTGGNSLEHGRGIAADTSGNIYISGYFTGTMTLGGSTITSQGARDILVSKLNSNGAWQWAVSAGGTNTDEAHSVSANTNNNIYVSGRFEGESSFGSITLNSQGGDDVFIAKLGDPPQYTVSFQTDPTNGGTITFDGNTYSNGDSTQKVQGSYSVSANPGSGYFFNCWTTAGGVSVQDQYSQSTTATVNGDGSIKAYFNSNQPPNPPSQPTGTTSGYHGVSYPYSTSAIDPENQQVKIYFDWGDGTGTWTDYVNSGQSVSKSHTWNSPGSYDIQAKAKDIYGAESSWSQPLTIILVNQAPHTPSNPNPENGATEVGINTILSWDGGDPNGDTVYYDVYFGTDEYNLDCVSTSQTSKTYDPSGELDQITTYFWKIVSEDEFGDQAIGPIWSFTTRDYHAPVLSYYDGWQTGHIPDSGNQQTDFTFCIHYEDEDEDPPIVKKVLFSNGVESTMELFNGQAYNGDYKVVLKGSQIGGGTHTYWFWYEDIHDDVRFPNPGEEDAVTINYAPNAPILSGPSSGTPGAEYIFSAVSDDPEGDDIKYKFYWDDGTDTGWIPETEWKASGDSIDAKHSWSKGTYTIRAKSMDRDGDESPWSNEITLKVQKSRVINNNFLREIIEKIIQKFPLLNFIISSFFLI